MSTTHSETSSHAICLHQDAKNLSHQDHVHDLNRRFAKTRSSNYFTPTISRKARNATWQNSKHDIRRAACPCKIICLIFTLIYMLQHTSVGGSSARSHSGSHYAISGVIDMDELYSSDFFSRRPQNSLGTSRFVFFIRLTGFI